MFNSFSLAAEKRPDAPEMLLNFGIWGPGPKDRQKFPRLIGTWNSKSMNWEGKTVCMSMLIIRRMSSSIYNRKEYDELRVNIMRRICQAFMTRSKSI
jgi:Delta24-sterol reductase